MLILNVKQQNLFFIIFKNVRQMLDRKEIKRGPFWTVPELLFESKEFVSALQQLLLEHHH